jgi:hypothetical protein
MTPRALTHDDVSRAIVDDDTDADFRPLEVCHCYSLIIPQLKQNPLWLALKMRTFGA